MSIPTQREVPQYSGAWTSGQVSYLPKSAALASHKPVGVSKTPLGADATVSKQLWRYSILAASQLQERPIAWAVKGLFPQKGLGLIYGASGAGKSFLALDLAAAIAEGRPWFGHRTTRAPVIYLCLEGAAGFLGRIRAWEASNGRALTELVGFVRESFNLLNQECVLELVHAIGSFAKTVSADPGPPVIVIDTLNRAMPGADENGSSAMGAVLEACSLISEASGGLTLLVHHVGKDPERGARGHSSLIAAVDASLMVVRSAKGRFWEAKKVKDGMDGTRGDFELESVTLGVDADGDDVSSCVVRRSQSGASEAKAPEMSASVRTALLSLQAVLTLTGPPAEGACAVSLEGWREVLYKNTTASSPSGKRNAFSRALSELQELGFVTVNGKSLEVSLEALELLRKMPE
jgi:hypothetical protein